jgi:ribosomal protein L16 Arg81 hydroxylase
MTEATEVSAPSQASAVPDGFERLAALLERPEDLELLRDAWGQRPLRCLASSAATELVSMVDIEMWLNHSNLRPPQVALLSGGNVVPSAEIVTDRTSDGRVSTGYVDPQRVREWLGKGATLQLYPIEEWQPSAASICRELALALRARVHAIAFLSPPHEYGRRVHLDAGHAFAIQISGSKEWEIFQGPHPQPGSSPEQVVTLHPGDLLYVPLRAPHRARAGDDGSLHATITISEPTLRMLVRTWARTYGRSFELNEWIAGDHGRRIELTRAWLMRMADSMGSVDAETLLETVEREWVEPATGRVSITALKDQDVH